MGSSLLYFKTKEKNMKKAFENILVIICSIIIIIMGIVLAFVAVTGMLEIAWWIITGEFFHFASIEPSSIF